MWFLQKEIYTPYTVPAFTALCYNRVCYSRVDLMSLLYLYERNSPELLFHACGHLVCVCVFVFPLCACVRACMTLIREERIRFI